VDNLSRPSARTRVRAQVILVNRLRMSVPVTIRLAPTPVVAMQSAQAQSAAVLDRCEY
jgi:hypothetical protein